MCVCVSVCMSVCVWMVSEHVTVREVADKSCTSVCTCAEHATITPKAAVPFQERQFGGHLRKTIL